MIVETLRSRLTAAIKASDRDGKRIYRFILGEFDKARQPVADEAAVKIMRTWLNEARGAGKASFSAREVELLSEMVPPVLSAAECLRYLNDNGVDAQIKDCPSNGMAIGVAMRAFSSGKRSVDGAVVKALVEGLRAAVTS